MFFNNINEMDTIFRCQNIQCDECVTLDVKKRAHRHWHHLARWSAVVECYDCATNLTATSTSQVGHRQSQDRALTEFRAELSFQTRALVPISWKDG